MNSPTGQTRRRFFTLDGSSDADSEPSEICNKLNNYFCSVGAKLAQSLSSGSNNDYIKCLPVPNKNSMFCGFVDIASHFGGEIPQKPQFLGRE